MEFAPFIHNTIYRYVQTMTTVSGYWIFITLVFLSACKNRTEKQVPVQKPASDCQPYFSYDHVEHYYLNIPLDDIWKMEEKENTTAKEEQQLDLLLQNAPKTLSDTSQLKDIDKIGFSKKEIAESKFDSLSHIFCERKHKEAWTTACIPVFRDILVFRKNGRIIGTAKICFECGQHVIAGTTKNTGEFGQSGDYEKLYKLLH